VGGFGDRVTVHVNVTVLHLEFHEHTAFAGLAGEEKVEP
jgi:hypothetical protein